VRWHSREIRERRKAKTRRSRGCATRSSAWGLDAHLPELLLLHEGVDIGVRLLEGLEGLGENGFLRSWGGRGHRSGSVGVGGRIRAGRRAIARRGGDAAAIDAGTVPRAAGGERRDVVIGSARTISLVLFCVTSLCEAKSGGEWFDFRWSSSDAGGVGPAFSFADNREIYIGQGSD
jgi:hypothetical protein